MVFTTVTPGCKYSVNNTAICRRIIGNAYKGAEMDLIAASLAKSTWATHSSALNCFEKFMLNKKRDVSWPISLNDPCQFVTWALNEGKLKPSTIKTYLASLNTVHKLKNIPSMCNEYIVLALVKGAENLALYNPSSEGSRKVMTLPLLKVLGHQIANSNWSPDSKATVWTACVVSDFG
jgi:hypothetical protein